jgi:tRNA-dihydrouridine synthase
MSGRHRILDEVKRSEICALVAAGCSLRSVANYVGCDRATIRREELRNPEFADKIRRAELEAELNPLRTMQEAAATHWRAAAWMLERTRPEQYARVGANLVKIETVHDLVERCLEVIAEELAGSPDSEAACRRLTSAIENTCGELTVAAIASRDPKRLRKVIANMSTRDEGEVAAEPVAEAVIAAQTELLQNTPVAAK